MKKMYGRGEFTKWKADAVACGAKVQWVTKSKSNTYYQANIRGLLIGFFNQPVELVTSRGGGLIDYEPDATVKPA